MNLNDMEKKALEICEMIRSMFGERASTTNVYDVVDENGFHKFKIQFMAYNYFSIVFQYENDIIGCSIECGTGQWVPLTLGMHCYSDENMEFYFKEVMRNIELRIPDKYLRANGWI